jgi:Protein of unknown function (DUF4197)
MRTLAVFLAALLTATAAHALGLSDLTDKDASGGLKEALTQGADRAVDLLGRPDGFLGNAKVKIPLPDSLRRAENLMRTLGMGKYADDLVVAMNRAAEAAVPSLLVKSVKQMTVQDATGILTGGDDAATQYFRRSTSAELTARFKPIVAKAMAKVKLAQKYDEFAGKAAKIGLLKAEDAHLEDYVTAKALDGLYLMIGEEEKSIRQDPMAAAGNLAKKVFGALR